MEKILSLTSTLFLLSLSLAMDGQDTFFRPSMVRKALYFDITPPLSEMHLIKPARVKKKEQEIPNQLDRDAFNHPQPQPFRLVEDPVWQKQDGTYSPAMTSPIQNFDGIGNLSGLYPPDTQGDIGPNYYVQVVNSNFAVWNKTGTLLYGPAALSTIWAGIPAPWNGTNNGDPIVIFDQAADRWIISQFSLPTGNYAELVAVSQTSDPRGAWYRYVFQFGNKMPDYPKFGIWPDAYYLSCNQFIGGNSWGGVGACALERAKMLTGDPTARMVYFDLGGNSDPSNMLPSDWDGSTPPLANEPNYFVYFNDWSSATDYYLKIWQLHIDWINTSNSTFTEAYSILTAPFKSSICAAVRSRCIPQPGTSVKLESLSDRLMYRLQYRNFTGHQSMVTNHTVDVDGSGHAGVRWYELRNNGNGWSLYQQGTYAPDASHRWVGSVAMNFHGDIALGYSVSNNSTVYPTIRYTGRFAGDPPGQMTFPEQIIINGSGYQNGTAARWGDYSMMSVDPADDSTFWYTTEYIQTSGTANWKTRIASFKFNYIVPVADFSAGTTTPCLSNAVIFTDKSTGNPTSWQWTFNPSTVTYVNNSSSSSKNPQVKFNKYGIYTVSLQATNGLGNNTMTKTNYISVNIANPDFGAGLTQVPVGYNTVFYDSSTCNITSWSWNFGSGAIPATANTKGPHTVTYSTTGVKTISLTVNGSLTKTKTNYINVTTTEFNMSRSAITICSGNFYDPGGPSANYPDFSDYTMSFSPATPNTKLRFVFNSFNLEAESTCSFDWLKIYNGNSSFSPLIGTYCGTTSPGTVTANNLTGSLTFLFHSDEAVNNSGWSAAISCISNNLPPVANFSENDTTPNPGATVTLTDLSTGNPTSWLWSFTPNTVTYVDGTSATSQNPKVQFDNHGIYSVGLTATNAYGSNVKTKTNHIYAGTHGLWTGTISSEWNTPSNWDNYIIPSASTNVSLPSSAPHWPSLTGDMILGIKCNNLVLQRNSELTSNGNFVINPGDTLTFSGTGTIKTEGDWSDYGIFNSGTGNVEFIGSAPAKITGGINKQIYVANYIRTPFTGTMTNISGGIAGPSGDDANSDVPIGFSFNYLGINYSQSRINTNGWISLNSTGSADAVDNSDLFSTSLPVTALAPWWDDLSSDATSSIMYKTEGVAPDRVFIVEWKRVRAFYSTGTTARISFQVKLYETSNVIEFCYGTAEAGNHDISESASIGIKDATGGNGHFKEATTGSTTTDVTNLSSASNWPTANYRFSPPSPKGVFYNLIENKTNATLTIQPDIIVNGDVILK